MGQTQLPCRRMAISYVAIISADTISVCPVSGSTLSSCFAYSGATGTKFNNPLSVSLNAAGNLIYVAYNTSR